MKVRAYGNYFLKTNKVVIAFLTIAVLLANTSSLAYAVEARQSDQSTSGTYEQFFENQEDLLSKNGALWGDKSVSGTDIELDGITVKNTSDFLVTHSLLAKSFRVINQSEIPTDMVFVIDLSGSMYSAPYGGYIDPTKESSQSRLSATLEALNESIDQVLQNDENNKIAVVGFGKWTVEILPLGRYEKDGNGKYLSLSKESVTLDGGEKIVLSNCANEPLTMYVPSDPKKNNISTATNIQQGMYEGMKILTQTEQVEERKPMLVFLGDGAPYASYSGKNWWTPNNVLANAEKDLTDKNIPLHTLRAMMTTTYMKQEVEARYNTTLDVYTIGMGLDALYKNPEIESAKLCLNPEAFWDQENQMNTIVKDMWEQYKAGKEELEWNEYNLDPLVNRTTLFAHPDPEVTDITKYVTEYYSANNYEECIDAFKGVTDKVTSVTEATSPIDRDAYALYQDTIGRYMEVKDVVSVIYNEVEFTNPVVTTSDNKTQYVFEGTVNTGVFQDADLSQLIVEVNSDPTTGFDILTVKTPVSILPVQIDEVVQTEDGSVSLKSTGTMKPLRVNYLVGMQNEIINESGYVDMSKLDSDYVANNLDSDGNVLFYSNFYSEQKEGETTIGDTTLKFTPTSTSRFYEEFTELAVGKEVNNSKTSETSSYSALINGTMVIAMGNNGTLVAKQSPPVVGKDVYSSALFEQSINNEAVDVGQELVYRIDWEAPEGGKVVIEDYIPEFTTYVPKSASPSASYVDGKLTWELGEQAIGTKGFVSFSVIVDEDAGNQIVKNIALVNIGEYILETNETENSVTVEEIPEEPNDPTMTPSSTPPVEKTSNSMKPATGDQTMILFWLLIGSLSILSVVYFQKRMKK